MALAMINTIPPRGHFAEAEISADGNGCFTLTTGTAEFGNGSTNRARPVGCRCAGRGAGGDPHPQLRHRATRP